ncbi:hypothetical protein FGO68_gene9260 [Halteria grandinella]|uniref:Uncharacterized protein n=1 Tax=Halteria grandinella TaxID=5974 RepID=A0A8J8T864_HALGN|nr:hypothetical protein FGO68_gene9260 [Halteria grandinella]
MCQIDRDNKAFLINLYIIRNQKKALHLPQSEPENLLVSYQESCVLAFLKNQLLSFRSISTYLHPLRFF